MDLSILHVTTTLGGFSVMRSQNPTAIVVPSLLVTVRNVTNVLAYLWQPCWVLSRRHVWGQEPVSVSSTGTGSRWDAGHAGCRWGTWGTAPRSGMASSSLHCEHTLQFQYTLHGCSGEHLCCTQMLCQNNNKKRRNATKPGFQRFNQVLIWQE